MAIVPNEAIKTIIDNPRLLKHTGSELHRIPCPHCTIGYVLTRVIKMGIGTDSEVKVPDINKPHKCEVCGKWVRLKMQLRITGAPLSEGEKE